jgi:hypothetical protein
MSSANDNRLKRSFGAYPRAPKDLKDNHDSGHAAPGVQTPRKASRDGQGKLRGNSAKKAAGKEGRNSLISA